MIKALIFDVGGVLINGGWRSAYRKIAKKSKISLDEAFLIIQPIRDEWSKGAIREKEFWRKLEKKTGKELSASFKKDFWFEEYIKKRKDIKQVWKIVSALRKKGFRLAILSNTTPPHLKANRKSGRLERLRKFGFKTIVLSCQVRARKPELKIFRILLKRLKLPGKECIFIDDHLQNIRAARKLGIKGIHFKNPKQLRTKLIKLGLL